MCGKPKLPANELREHPKDHRPRNYNRNNPRLPGQGFLTVQIVAHLAHMIHTFSWHRSAARKNPDASRVTTIVPFEAGRLAALARLYEPPYGRLVNAAVFDAL